jgi:hypothetical protein
MNTNLRMLVAALGLAIASNSAFGATMYSSGHDGEGLATFDTTTGVGTFVGNYGANLHAGYALAVDNTTGTLYTLMNSYSDGRLSTVNALTGAATVFGASNGIADMMILEIDNAGNMYSASWATDSLYKMNKTTGVATFIGSLGFGDIMDLAFDATGTLWATNMSSLYKINTTTAASTFVANLSGISGNMGIAFDANNNLFGTEWGTPNSRFLQINTTTGVATVINSASGISSPHGGDIAQGVPDAGGTVTLLGLGFLSLAALRRRSAGRN